MRHRHEFDLLPLGAFSPVLGRMRLYSSDSPPPPDYTPLANASKESADIMAALGKDQLDFTKLQYEENKPLVQKVVDQQMKIADDTAAQGKDYYDYQIAQQRPVEKALNDDAMKAGSEAEQDAAAGRAMADVRQGTTQQQNQLIRQGLRYGLSPKKMEAMAGSAAATSGLAVASAANGAREKEKTLGYAKKLDVAGLYRGLPGASQGAYGVALNAGNSATANQAAPGQAMQAGMASGASTIGSGRSMYQQGLGSILNAQASMYEPAADNTGAFIGAAGGIAVAVI